MARVFLEEHPYCTRSNEFLTAWLQRFRSQFYYQTDSLRESSYSYRSPTPREEKTQCVRKHLVLKLKDEGTSSWAEKKKWCEPLKAGGSWRLRCWQNNLNHFAFTFWLYCSSASAMSGFDIWAKRGSSIASSSPSPESSVDQNTDTKHVVFFRRDVTLWLHSTRKPSHPHIKPTAKCGHALCVFQDIGQ